jgi:hypothetical protein
MARAATPRRQPGRPAKRIDPSVLETGKVDTYSRMTDLKGVERDRRVLWERLRKQRQKAARDRFNAPCAPAGVDLLAEMNAERLRAMTESRNLADQLAVERKANAELRRKVGDQ